MAGGELRLGIAVSIHDYINIVVYKISNKMSIFSTLPHMPTNIDPENPTLKPNK